MHQGGQRTPHWPAIVLAGLLERVDAGPGSWMGQLGIAAVLAWEALGAPTLRPPTLRPPTLSQASLMSHARTQGSTPIGTQAPSPRTHAGASFLMWELSTPFVYARWVLLKLGKADSKLVTVNNLVGFLVFVLCRNIYGPSEFKGCTLRGGRLRRCLWLLWWVEGSVPGRQQQLLLQWGFGWLVAWCSLAGCWVSGGFIGRWDIKSV
jgi:hypothetical protein